MNSHPRLSVLDLVPVRSGQTSAQAVAASLELVRLADRLGFVRYWFAEHHNMPAVASTSPPVLAAAAATATRRIRVGSGGVMLPNHAPLIVAEQFSALAALAPGRVDLGLGRAPGSDSVITQLLRYTGPTSDVDRFGDQVAEIIALMHPDGASLQLSNGQVYDVRSTPAANVPAKVWLLGSSDFSARLAAEMGLPYVFANHFSGAGLEQVVGLYRARYQPSEDHPTPVTFLTVNVSVAPTEEEARRRALPQQRMMVRLRTGQPLTALETVEEAEAAGLDPATAALVEQIASRWIIGEPGPAATQLRDLAASIGVEEVMLVPIAGSFDGEPADQTPGRTQSVSLLAEALAG